MPVRLALAIAASLVLAGAFAHMAAADAYREVLSIYEAEGSIPPCQFSSPQLEAALRGEDAYGAQYFADFTDAIQSALAQRASGACTRRGQVAARSQAGGA